MSPRGDRAATRHHRTVTWMQDEQAVSRRSGPAGTSRASAGVRCTLVLALTATGVCFTVPSRGVAGEPAARAAIAMQRPAHADAEIEGDLPGERTARVVVRAEEVASISSELNARITYLPRREGDRFRKGDVIVEFDCRRVAAERDAAEAVVKGLRSAYESQQRLLEYNAAGTAAVEQSLYDLERAQAELAGIGVRLETCRILAPFDGTVIEKGAQAHEIAQPNQVLIKIVNEARLDLVMMVPSRWLPLIAAAPRVAVDIDETGQTLEARIVQSTGVIDPVSQSARIIAEFTGPAPGVLPGMSGTARFADP